MHLLNCFASNVKRMVLAAGGFLLLLHSASAATSLLSNVPEASKYKLAYEHVITPNMGNLNNGFIYATNNTAAIAPGSFDRVAYYLELQNGVGALSWIYVSMNAFDPSANRLGVPTTGSGEFYNRSNTPIASANIFSNVGGIVTGTGINTVNLEFWPSNYNTANDYGVTGANTGTYDFGDGGANTGNGYGSMQIHNYASAQTLFSYSGWGADGGDDNLGIGNQVGGTGNPDWTFNTANINAYSVRTLQILVTPEPSRALFLLAALMPLAFWRKRRARN